MARSKVKSVTDQRPFTMVYNDFLESKLLDKNQKLLFIAIKRYANNDTMKAFPSYKKLHEMTGLSITWIKKNIDIMKELGVISVEKRRSEEKGNESNLYTLYDYADVWGVKPEKDSSIESIAEEIEIAKMIAKLQANGYTVTKNDLQNEKRLESETDQSTDPSPSTNHIITNNDNIGRNNSQEQYSMEYVKEQCGYKELLFDLPDDIEIIDYIMTIIYDTDNSADDHIRVLRKDYPKDVVIAAFQKLRYGSVRSVIEKYKKKTNRVDNPRAYLRTLLYDAVGLYPVDIYNRVQNDLYGNNND